MKRILIPTSNHCLKQEIGQKPGQKPGQRPGQEQGAVMITVLLLLVILTLLAISSLSTTRLEEMMAHNSQVRSDVLLRAEGSAETGVSAVIDGTTIGTLIARGVGSSITIASTIISVAGTTIKGISEATYLGESAAPRNSGFAISRSGSATPPAVHHLNVSGTQTITAVDTTAIVNIGISVVGSSNSNGVGRSNVLILPPSIGPGGGGGVVGGGGGRRKP